VSFGVASAWQLPGCQSSSINSYWQKNDQLGSDQVINWDMFSLSSNQDIGDNQISVAATGLPIQLCLQAWTTARPA